LIADPRVVTILLRTPTLASHHFGAIAYHVGCIVRECHRVDDEQNHSQLARTFVNLAHVLAEVEVEEKRKARAGSWLGMA